MQWITRLTTDQKIPGSNPGELDHAIFYAHMYIKSDTRFTNKRPPKCTFRLGLKVKGIKT